MVIRCSAKQLGCFVASGTGTGQEHDFQEQAGMGVAYGVASFGFCCLSVAILVQTNSWSVRVTMSTRNASYELI